MAATTYDLDASLNPSMEDTLPSGSRTTVWILGSSLTLYQYFAFGDPLRTPQTFKTGNIVNGIFGLMLDRYYGLLTYTPGVILSTLGMTDYGRSRTAFAVTTSSFLGLYLTASYEGEVRDIVRRKGVKIISLKKSNHELGRK